MQAQQLVEWVPQHVALLARQHVMVAVVLVRSGRRCSQLIALEPCLPNRRRRPCCFAGQLAPQEREQEQVQVQVRVQQQLQAQLPLCVRGLTRARV